MTVLPIPGDIAQALHAGGKLVPASFANAVENPARRELDPARSSSVA
jgi:hypothetical protein